MIDVLLQHSEKILGQPIIVYEGIIEEPVAAIDIRKTDRGDLFKLSKFIIELSIPNNSNEFDLILGTSNWTYLQLYSQNSLVRTDTLEGYSNSNNTYSIMVGDCAGDIIPHKGRGIDADGDFEALTSMRLRTANFKLGKDAINYIDRFHLRLQYSKDGSLKAASFPEGTFIRIVGINH